jgi:hypothetical protein
VPLGVTLARLEAPGHEAGIGAGVGGAREAEGSSMQLFQVSAVIGPTPGTLIRRAATGSASA